MATVEQLFKRKRVLRNTEIVFHRPLEEIGAERLLKFAELTIRTGCKNWVKLCLLRNTGRKPVTPTLYVADESATVQLELGASLSEARIASYFRAIPSRTAEEDPIEIGSSGFFDGLLGQTDPYFEVPPIQAIAAINPEGAVVVRDVSSEGTAIYADWTGAIPGQRR